MNHPFPYRLARSEPGIYTELYLPKRAQFQGALFEALTQGFRFEQVRRHFLDLEKRPQINALLEVYPGLAGYSDARIEALQPFEWGYSVYQVDGVYYSAEQDRAMEESTQVIRIMFQPDLNRLRRDPELDHLAPQDLIDRVAQVLREVGQSNSADEPDPATRKVRQFLGHWKDDIALFLFGYLVFEIADRIRELHAQNETPLEEEIWVTSFWNLEVSRVELREVGAARQVE